jgi:NAD(P)-dependent dehydrogenase (short-subunit alcohol dehydrogenase family)
MQPTYEHVSIIIGATGGIGRSLVTELTNDGHRLVLGARDRRQVETLAEEVGALPYALDATHFDQVKWLFDYTVEQHGRVDSVVNLVGSILLKPAHLTTPDELKDVIGKNLYSAFFTVKAAARAMMSNGGSIVLMSSAAARIGLPNHEAISLAKAGIEGLTRSAAATYALRNIRVNAVAPGLIRTPLSAPLLSSGDGESRSIEMHPLKRIGDPSDVASVIRWLLDPQDGRWITGQVIGVDGGLATVRPRT